MFRGFCLINTVPQFSHWFSRRLLRNPVLQVFQEMQKQQVSSLNLGSLKKSTVWREWRQSREASSPKHLQILYLSLRTSQKKPGLLKCNRERITTTQTTLHSAFRLTCLYLIREQTEQTAGKHSSSQLTHTAYKHIC